MRLHLQYSRFNTTYLVRRVQVLGLDSPAGRAGVKEGDVLVSVQDTLVTQMKHSQVRLCTEYCGTK